MDNNEDGKQVEQKKELDARKYYIGEGVDMSSGHLLSDNTTLRRVRSFSDGITYSCPAEVIFDYMSIIQDKNHFRRLLRAHYYDHMSTLSSTERDDEDYLSQPEIKLGE